MRAAPELVVPGWTDRGLRAGGCWNSPAHARAGDFHHLVLLRGSHSHVGVLKVPDHLASCGVRLTVLASDPVRQGFARSAIISMARRSAVALRMAASTVRSARPAAASGASVHEPSRCCHPRAESDARYQPNPYGRKEVRGTNRLMITVVPGVSGDSRTAPTAGAAGSDTTVVSRQAARRCPTAAITTVNRALQDVAVRTDEDVVGPALCGVPALGHIHRMGQRLRAPASNHGIGSTPSAAIPVENRGGDPVAAGRIHPRRQSWSSEMGGRR